MKPSLRLVLLAGLLTTQSLSQSQSPPKVGEKSQAAVDQLRAIVKEIKRCPKFLAYEYRETKGPLAGARIYHGPPQNVGWDVGESKSIRSFYQGYIEVHIPQQFWLPPDVTKKYGGDKAPVWYTKMVYEPWPTLEYRYEFDVGPRGLELYKSSSRTSGKAEWGDYGPLEAGGNCWDEAVRKGVSGAGERQQ
jgi:hypothetical protein